MANPDDYLTGIFIARNVAQNRLCHIKTFVHKSTMAKHIKEL